MICASRTAALVLDACVEIAAELKAEASDPTADLSQADRTGLAVLSRAVGTEAARWTAAAALAERETVPDPVPSRPHLRLAHSEAIPMFLPEILRWAAVAAITAAVIRFPRPSAFWSLGAGRPFVLARSTGPNRFRPAVGV